MKVEMNYLEEWQVVALKNAANAEASDESRTTDSRHMFRALSRAAEYTLEQERIRKESNVRASVRAEIYKEERIERMAAQIKILNKCVRKLAIIGAVHPETHREIERDIYSMERNND